MFILDRTSPEPLHRQLHGQIEDSIRSRELNGNARLPSSRALAKLLGVSRNTVMTAYETLASQGAIYGKRGSGMWVNSTTKGRGIRVMGLRRAVRDAHYPERSLALTDPDGNPIHLIY